MALLFQCAPMQNTAIIFAGRTPISILHKDENKTKYKIIQQQKQSEKKLKEIYLACQQQKIEFVTSEILGLHKIDVFSAPETGIDQKTQNKIFWFFEYGVLGIAYEKFKIIKKSDYGRLHSV
ncbi:MAG: hypothetical protein IPN61_20065 [Bacteroidetes bacterium]|nr:hypothetical protein [Bacteroidota bacterium]